jgi:precorrin-2 dehydrogenase/sirohydrochlorin ferrochelatase
MKKYYPVFLDVEGRKCVVVGGGTVALRKAKALADAGARVGVVSPQFCRSFLSLEKKATVTLFRKRFQANDLDRAFLAIACTDDRNVNDRVHDAANRRGILVNVVDFPPQCNFIVPSVVSRGALTIAVSTSGVSPALARRIRIELESLYDNKYATFLALMKKARDKVIKEVSSAQKRKKLFESLTTPRFLSEFAGKQKGDAKRLFEEKLRALLSRAKNNDV